VVSSHEDPLAADRRTLAIAAVVMVALVAVGVGSAALFTGSGCRAIAPTPADPGDSAGDVEEVLAAAFPNATEAQVLAMGEVVTAMAGVIGPLMGVTDVRDAPALAVLGDRVAAVGTTTTVLDPSGAARSAASFDPGATLVGDGASLYSLALVNDLTGQVDALLPVDAGLEGRTCVDTATVGTPLAFHLDAGDGELLLLRVEEDGDDPRLELRNPVAGRVWSTPVQLARAPAGILAERVVGRLGPDLVVLGGRTTVDDLGPVLTAAERAGGGIAWQLEREAFGELLPDGAAWVDVVLVTDRIVVVAISPETSRGQGTLVALEPSDGSRRWVSGDDAPLRAVDAVAGDRELLIVVAGSDGIELVEIAIDDGRRVPVAGIPGASTGAVVPLGDRSAVLVTDGAVALAGDREVATWSSPFVGRDVVHHPGGVTLLLGGPGRGAVAITFGT
jgi:hypothetical protein